jgi:ABC-type lipoprotein export system ATPase subunit
MTSPLVVADQICRTYQLGGASVDALRNASCVVMPGQRIALTGPSGSGKSTLLHLLGGLDRPDRGRIDWPALGARSELRPKKIVDIFQGPSLLEPLSVIENVKLPLLLAGITDQAARISARIALEQFGLEPLADKLPEEISGGQAQRVSIARALVVRPAFILADEPTGQLDVATAAAVLKTMLDSARELGAAIIVSTHDRRIADQLDEHWSIRDGVLDTGHEARMHAVTIAASLTQGRPQ